jgi:hypothetical protein
MTDGDGPPASTAAEVDGTAKMEMKKITPKRDRDRDKDRDKDKDKEASLERRTQGKGRKPKKRNQL